MAPQGFYLHDSPRDSDWWCLCLSHCSLLSPTHLGLHSSSSSAGVMDKPHDLAAGPRLHFLAGILLPSLVCTQGVSCGWQSTPYFITQQARQGCFMAYIHAYFLSPSACIADMQLSSSGVGSFYLQVFFAIALQSGFVHGRWSVIWNPPRKPHAPGICLFFFFNRLWFSSLTTGASALPKTPCMLQRRGSLLLPPGDHLHTGVGDASWSFAHTRATASPDCKAVG